MAQIWVRMNPKSPETSSKNSMSNMTARLTLFDVETRSTPWKTSLAYIFVTAASRVLNTVDDHDRSRDRGYRQVILKARPAALKAFAARDHALDSARYATGSALESIVVSIK